MESRTVDILIPVFKTDHLEECLKSVMKQTGLGRVILLNNTGDEEIYSVTSKFSEEIKIIQPGNLLPAVTACLVLAEAAEAEWIRFLGDDDLLLDNALSPLLDVAASFDGIVMSFSSFGILKPDGHRKIISFDFPEYISGADYLFNIYCEVPFTTLSNAVIKRKCLESVSRLMPEKMINVCGLFAMHAMAEGSLTYINTPTVNIRQPEYRIIPAQAAESDMYHVIEPLNYFMGKRPQDTKRIKWLKIKRLAALADGYAAEYLKRGRYADFIYIMRTVFSLNPQAGLLSLTNVGLYRTFIRRLFRRIHR